MGGIREPDSGSYASVLDGTHTPDYQPRVEPATYPPLYQGVAVPSGVAVVSLRFDDGKETMNSVVAPLLAARDLTCGISLVSTFLGVASYMTTAEALALIDTGYEALGHSATHGSDPADWASFVAETLTAAAALRTAGFNVQAFVQPGTWTSGYNFNSVAQVNSAAMMYLQRNFSAVHANLLESLTDSSFVTTLPSPHIYGSNHVDLSTKTLAQLKQEVDFAIAAGGLIQFICHDSLINSGGSNISTVDFTAFLDYLVTQRDAGLLQILTPTGALYCQPGEQPMNLLSDPGFERWGSYAGATRNWTVAGSPTLVAGRFGGNAMQVTDVDTVKQSIKTFPGITQVRVSAWCRTPDGVARNPRLTLQGYDSGGTVVNYSKFRTFTSAAPADGSWAKVIQHFGIRPGSQKFTVQALATTGNVQFDDMEVVRV